MPEFNDIATSIREKGKPKRMTVRALMKSIGHERRGKNVNRKLRAMLNRSKLTTEPDFELVNMILTWGSSHYRNPRRPGSRPLFSGSLPGIRSWSSSLLIRQRRSAKSF